MTVMKGALGGDPSMSFPLQILQNQAILPLFGNRLTIFSKLWHKLLGEWLPWPLGRGRSLLLSLLLCCQ